MTRHSLECSRNNLVFFSGTVPEAINELKKLNVLIPHEYQDQRVERRQHLGTVVRDGPTPEVEGNADHV